MSAHSISYMNFLFDEIFSQLPLLSDSFGVLTLLPLSQSPLVLLPMQDKTEGEFFLQRLRTPLAKSNSPPFGLTRI